MIIKRWHRMCVHNSVRLKSYIYSARGPSAGIIALAGGAIGVHGAAGPRDCQKIGRLRARSGPSTAYFGRHAMFKVRCGPRACRSAAPADVASLNSISG